MAAASAGSILKEVAAEDPSAGEEGNCSSSRNEIEDSSSDEEGEGCRYYKVKEPEGSL